MPTEKAQNQDAELLDRIYLEDKKAVFDKLTKRRFSDETLKTEEIINGIVLPPVGTKGGVCDENFNFISGNEYFRKGEKPTEVTSSGLYLSDSYPVDEKNLDYCDETVVFGGYMINHPGHIVYESLSRMWWHCQNPDSKYRFVFIQRYGTNFTLEFLDLLGIPEDRILFIDKPTKFSKIIIPEQSLYRYSPSKCFTKEYMAPINLIKKNVAPSPYEKIYLTRKKVQKNDIINEDYFIDFYMKKGYKIIHPEEYSVREKFSFFRGAKEIACLGGTNALYSVFSEPSVKIFILGRSSEDPVAEFYIPYEAAGIKDCYIIDCCLNFLHHNRVWGINLVGPTEYWRKFVKDYYNEELQETPEDTIREYSFDYLKRFAEYYSKPEIFKEFSHFSHFQIIQLLNKIFLNKKLDYSQYQGQDTESQLKYIKTALNFFMELSDDFAGKKRFERFFINNKNKKLGILFSSSMAAEFLIRYAKQVGIKICYVSYKKAILKQLTNEEWDLCKKCDIIVSCEINWAWATTRDNKKAVTLWDILRDDSLTADLPQLPNTNTDLSDTFTAELKAVREELSAQVEQLTGQISEYRVDLAGANQLTQLQTQQLMQRIKELQDDKDKLSAEIGKINCENDHLKEKLRQSVEQHEALSDAHKALHAEYQSILSQRDELGRELTRSSAETKQAKDALNAADQEIERLKDKLHQMENSRSWRYTRIFRKKPTDE